ncbi:Hypothetical predicted protein [Podarcis lilfordi]|uniref:Uncharacterized protein n=1 Tax=Podarcis lilfordi TaxID=74358 RepID=A0AA35P6S9_9SAUR|nr:Hypothetical predicted protein [Podarcis lilfordi]
MKIWRNEEDTKEIICSLMRQSLWQLLISFKFQVCSKQLRELLAVVLEQLQPKALWERLSHLSPLVTRCHLLLPGLQTAEQTMSHAC